MCIRDRSTATCTRPGCSGGNVALMFSRIRCRTNRLLVLWSPGPHPGPPPVSRHRTSAATIPRLSPCRRHLSLRIAGTLQLHRQQRDRADSYRPVVQELVVAEFEPAVREPRPGQLDGTGRSTRRVSPEGNEIGQRHGTDSTRIAVVGEKHLSTRNLPRAG